MRAHHQATRSSAGPSDAALVVASRAGEAWAQEALFRRHAPMVNGLAFRLMGRDADVDDLVQDSFVTAFAGLHGLDDPQAFAAWLGSIVVRTAGKVIRRRGCSSGSACAGGASPSTSTPWRPARRAPTWPRSCGTSTRLERLPAEQRIAFLLRRVEGMELEEVARTMGISLATAKRRIAAAQQAIERWADRE